MYSRILTYPKDSSFFLFGPRGTGKTSWLKQEFASALYIDMLEDSIFNRLIAHPERLEDMLREHSAKRVIIDEVQKAPKILDEIHRLIEKYRVPSVLTGSSARKLRRGGSNLLGGRASIVSMHPLTTIELKSDFSLAHSLQYGNLPLAYTRTDPKTFLESYIATYLREEVQQERLTRNVAAFARFLEACTFSQAAPLNISEVSRECSVERKVVEEYFTILEDLLLAVRIPVFVRRAKRDMTSHPKFMFFDTGIFRALRPTGPLDSASDIDGSALETLFFQEIRALNDYKKLSYVIYYWRSRNKVEVDFVLYGPRGLLAFEIKRSSNVRGRDLAGLLEFKSDYPEAKLFYLYGGSKEYREQGVNIIPFKRGLLDLLKII